ncbi:MAG: SDR family oxidoreductase [Emcibacter sp.]|nr:SDR family oxidoreductase [Emcibacter sp.]
MSLPSNSLVGRTAIITGGASGIGKAAAQIFAKAGANIALFDLSDGAKSVADELCKSGTAAIYHKIDITSEDDINKAVNDTYAQFKKIDILVHCAGIGIEKTFLDTTKEDWDRIINIDLTGTFLCCQAVAKKMMLNKYGRIITVASTAGIRGGYGRAAYGAAKGGVLTLTKVMAVELAQYGITVNTLAPGAIDTELVAKMHSAETRKVYTKAIPMKRYGTPEETAEAALFLAGEGASYVNGHILSVDGGFLAAGLMPED